MDELLFETRGNVAIITMNRPEARNAGTLDMANAMLGYVDRIDADPEIRVAVLTGAGGTFCAGMDLKRFLKGQRPSIEGKGFIGLTEAPPRKPIIAAVEGYALGGGCELALTCDLIVAGETARFGLPEVKRGLVARAGGILRLPRQMTYRKAMELLLTGDFFSATEALEFGLINRVTPEGGALEGALELAAKVAANAPLAVQAVKEVVVQSQDWPSTEMFQRQVPLTDGVIASKDAKEGAAAFAEKRAPRWRGE